jgi:hypothetical protein
MKYTKEIFRKEQKRMATKGTGFGGWSSGEIGRAK